MKKTTQFVYKYIPINANNGKVNLLKYFFEDKLLRFTNPLSFNDVFEFKPYVKKLVFNKEEEILNIGANLINSSGQANKSFYAGIDNELNKIGVLSLSENKQNLLMWAHYTDNHKGIVIEFDKEHDFFQNSNFLGYEMIHKLEQVIYSKYREHVNSDEYFDKKTFLTKSEEWEYENEYRMTIYNTSDNQTGDIDIVFPSSLIKSVYIGYRSSEETKVYIKNLREQKQWQHLKIYQMLVDEQEYKLNPILI